MSDTGLNPNDLSSNWVLTNLGAVVNYGSTAKAEPSEIAGEDWVLELEDIEKETSHLLQRMTFAQRQSKSTKNRFQAGDVLYGKLRPYLNKVLIVDQAGYCTTEIVPIEAGLHLDNRYLFYWLKHPAFLKYVEAESHGMNMPRLGTETGRAAPFVLVPRNEQTRIADRIEARHAAARDQVQRLTPLLLAKAFRGELVPQDLNDEPASELLARISAQRETNTAMKPKRGRGKQAAPAGATIATSPTTGKKPP